ncbi:hypothetical protein [Thauera sinica]|uniref:Uncharacterized protein n=1 Tax=Thauera sinica TaxID=2665146 RepID=A0ABW1ARG6_9RHOO|nr:hypothetical protein [Thauera sp. K11]
MKAKNFVVAAAMLGIAGHFVYCRPPAAAHAAASMPQGRAFRTMGLHSPSRPLPAEAA